MAKKSPTRCVTKWCRGFRPRHTRTWKRKDGSVVRRTYRLCLCWKCRSRQLKARHPATYVLNAIRQRAKKRGVSCTITLTEFKTWCEDTGYLEGRGRKADSLTIDRIDPDLGYSLDNIRVLGHRENSLRQDDPTDPDNEPF